MFYLIDPHSTDMVLLKWEKGNKSALFANGKHEIRTPRYILNLGMELQPQIFPAARGMFYIWSQTQQVCIYFKAYQ